jgi:UDP-N-acetylmuramoyl-L-alanyl-D-glutamate--2,6-diaminopimelate ligase
VTRVGSVPVPAQPIPRPSRVAPTRLGELADILPVTLPVTIAASGAERTAVSGAEGIAVTVTGVTHDSRDVRPGDLYAALPGSVRHGAEFAAQAAAAGATAVLTDEAGLAAVRDAGLPALLAPDPRAVLGPVSARVYGDPTARLAVLGITGTSGKTTTAYLAECGLRAAGHVTGLLGTVETRVAGDRLPSARTTPEAPELQALFAVMAERGVTAVAMEVSSHALALGRVEGTRFATAAYTNFGSDHLDFHVDRDDYFAAKARFFDGRAAAEVLHADDPEVAALARTRPAPITVSTRGPATWWADDLRGDAAGQTFTVHGPGGLRLPGRVGLAGRFNVDNALLAIAALVATGVDPRDAVRGVGECPGVPGRLERVTAADAPVFGVVDYAHKPDAVAAVLGALRPATEGRLLCVLGCGGDRDQGKRPLMGAAAARGADVLVVTDDNPRTEDPAAIRAAVLAGAREVPGADVVEIGDRAEAIAWAARSARPGDTVAVLGKGHEPYQEVAGTVLAFDDRAVLAAALHEVYA